MLLQMDLWGFWGVLWRTVLGTERFQVARIAVVGGAIIINLVQGTILYLCINSA